MDVGESKHKSFEEGPLEGKEGDKGQVNFGYLFLGVSLGSLLSLVIYKKLDVDS